MARRFWSILLSVTALSGLILTASAGGAAAASGQSAEPAATAAFPAPAEAGLSTEIVLDNGGYSKCLNYTGGQTTAGTKVELWTCNPNDVASQWLIEGDQIKPYRDDTMSIDAVNGQLVLEPDDDSLTASWYFSSTGEIISGQTTPGTNHYVLNDPGYRTANGTQLISYNQPAVTPNAHWYVVKAHYATSKLTNRPDDLGYGPWATDTITRASMIVYEGSLISSPTNVVYYYQASAVDTGTFVTIPGDQTPNQFATNGGLVLGPDPLTGTITGSAGYELSTRQYVSKAPAASYTGAGQPATADWFALFFNANASVGGSMETTGPIQEAWTYTSAQDACGRVETWVDAGYAGLGQSLLPATGNITAPAASSCSG